MELVHLEYFVVLADELHFGRAAARLHVGTSSMSKRISELEHLLGIRLFDRTSRDVRLTREGEALVAQARRVLSELSAFQALAADAAAGAIGSILAAYSPGTGELMTLLVSELRKTSPRVKVRLVQMLSVKVAEAVASRAADVGIARIPPGPQVATMVLRESPFDVVVLPPGHALAGHEEVFLRDLAGETLLGPAQSIGGGPSPLPSVQSRPAEVSSESELFDLVSSGFGIMATTEAVARRNPRQDVIIRPLIGAEVSQKEMLLWHCGDDSLTLRSILEAAERMRVKLSQPGDT